jgi:hypothetical protein
VTKATVKELVEANKLASAASDWKASAIWVQSIPSEEVSFCVLTDAAWANGQDKCSQAGYMIAAVDQKFLRNEWGTFSVLRWKSYKQDRQAHSTLGAELLSLSRGLAEARWVRSMWCEAIFSDYVLKEDKRWSQKIPIVAAVDCKPVYDHANSDTVSIKDKRMAIEMLLLKSDIRENNISLRWMATQQMIVDVLTKLGAPMALFRKVLAEAQFVLVEDKSVVEWVHKGGKGKQ